MTQTFMPSLPSLPSLTGPLTTTSPRHPQPQPAQIPARSSSPRKACPPACSPPSAKARPARGASRTQSPRRSGPGPLSPGGWTGPCGAGPSGRSGRERRRSQAAVAWSALSRFRSRHTARAASPHPHSSASSPVNMREVHRYIADTVLQSDKFDAAVERVSKRMLEHTGRKIAIAGSGPTGLTAAFYLALLGHDVTVFDPLPEAGGMLRFALPEYRLPKPVLKREIELIERLGVKFALNTRVGTDITLNELDERFDAVFLAIGTWKESWVYLPGTELKGVYPALPLLESIRSEEHTS